MGSPLSSMDKSRIHIRILHGSLNSSGPAPFIKIGDYIRYARKILSKILSVNEQVANQRWRCIYPNKFVPGISVIVAFIIKKIYTRDRVSEARLPPSA